MVESGNSLEIDVNINFV